MHIRSKFDENVCSSSKSVFFTRRLNIPCFSDPHWFGLLTKCAWPSTRLIPVKSAPAEEEDIDVARERQRVHDGRADNDLLKVCDLTKVTLFSIVVFYIRRRAIRFWLFVTFEGSLVYYKLACIAVPWILNALWGGLPDKPGFPENVTRWTFNQSIKKYCYSLTAVKERSFNVHLSVLLRAAMRFSAHKIQQMCRNNIFSLLPKCWYLTSYSNF